MGTKAIVWGTISGEVIAVVYDLRYMVILSAVLILADLWWGHAESMKRYHEAADGGDTALKDKYKWRKSRAVRRTLNKTVDYLTYLVIGALLGMGITEPMEICSHVWTAAIGLGLGGGCEIASIVGHIVYVKFGVELKIVDAWRVTVRFLGRLIKVKSAEIGEAVEELAKDEKDNEV